MEVTIQLDSPDRQLELFGTADDNLRLLRQALGVHVTARQANLIISGKEDGVNKAVEIIDRMQKHLIKRDSLTTSDVTFFLTENQSD